MCANFRWLLLQHTLICGFCARMCVCGNLPATTTQLCLISNSKNDMLPRYAYTLATLLAAKRCHKAPLQLTERALYLRVCMCVCVCGYISCSLNSHQALRACPASVLLLLHPRFVSSLSISDVAARFMTLSFAIFGSICVICLSNALWLIICATNVLCLVCKSVGAFLYTRCLWCFLNSL